MRLCDSQIQWRKAMKLRNEAQSMLDIMTLAQCAVHLIFKYRSWNIVIRTSHGISYIS